MKCTKCGFENPEKMTFCGRCGSELANLCPACESVNPPEFQFCGKCGAGLGGEAPELPRIEDMQERLHIPDPLLRRMESAQQEMEGENRLVTALFADISGFTALSQSMATEAEKAVEYQLKAGEKASRSSAYEAAIAHFKKGLGLLETMPESSERTRRELALQAALGPALMAIKGWGSQDVQHTYERAQELCEKVGESPELFPTLYGIYAFYAVRADHKTTVRKLAEKMLRVAESAQNSVFLMYAHYLLGCTFFYRGELIAAQDLFDQSIALCDAQEDRSVTFLFGQDPGVEFRWYSGHSQWYLGFPDRGALRASR